MNYLFEEQIEEKNKYIDNDYLSDYDINYF